ncbi:MAG: hypothetical protein GW855_02580 [Erythrobacter sp.]|nr:hypothetical protein [Erythrobacter sp.]NCQ63918.1 hypothetical protein [Alphaproteobacteria bacterium]
MKDKPTDYRALGIAFITMGVGLTISFGLTIGPAFLGIGLPFLVLGFVFLGRKRAEESPSETHDGN